MSQQKPSRRNPATLSTDVYQALLQAPAKPSALALEHLHCLCSV